MKIRIKNNSGKNPIVIKNKKKKKKYNRIKQETELHYTGIIIHTSIMSKL